MKRRCDYSISSVCNDANCLQVERRLHARALQVFKNECERGAPGQSELDQVMHVLRAYAKKPANELNSRVSMIAQAKLDELEANRCLASRLCVDS